eukprot:1161707-Pleurochrysis_carterae.AAC.1
MEAGRRRFMPGAPPSCAIASLWSAHLRSSATAPTQCTSSSATAPCSGATRRFVGARHARDLRVASALPREAGPLHTSGTLADRRAVSAAPAFVRTLAPAHIAVSGRLELWCLSPLPLQDLL